MGEGGEGRAVRAGQDLRRRILGHLVRPLPGEHPPPHRAQRTDTRTRASESSASTAWERDRDKVKPFVDEMGDKMEYRVGAFPDDVLEKKDNDVARRPGRDEGGRGERHPDRLHRQGRQDRLDRPPDGHGRAPGQDFDGLATGTTPPGLRRRLVEKTRGAKATQVREKGFPALPGSLICKATVAAIDEATSGDPVRRYRLACALRLVNKDTEAGWRFAEFLKSTG